ncbi:acetyltransferase [Pseudomonas vancouverensis]|uniref:Acetyltransferase n=1 Tax=Pseudomonas vancouverensis TaxID=95300 RepID=A0A1H2P4D7_PSEVA|nr:acetyltransferase [Pseudomonas vancouverensis]KAB0499763.1 acetyltransferase [Pseudomonas vancouverensis]TDB56752.1 acetyltransferase [Pseudomonas vancouverensis]SDV12587.1 sugar O-acyltransferase, sialic acid O-acetyltransferase NeuD family [Pseudomonas vancouverensis]
MKMFLLGAANPEAVRMILTLQRTAPHVQFAFLDNDPAKQGTLFHGVPVVGGTARVRELKGPDTRFVNLITGSTELRCRTTREIVEAGGTLGDFIHPGIDLTMVSHGVGTYLQEGVIMQAQVSLGDNSSISAGSVVGHEGRIGHSVFLAPGVCIAGCVDIGDGTFIGTNATILPRLRIGRWVTIGAGAVVTKDVPDYAVVAGNPARIIKTNPVSFQDGRVFS